VGEAQVGEALGEGLTGIAEVVQTLVAGEEGAGAGAAADVLVARPARRAPIDRRWEGRRPLAVAGDVVTVLVGEHELAAGAFRRRGVVAPDHDPVLTAVVAGLGAVAAVEFDLGRGVELDR